MAWGANNNGWWGEGEIKFYIDGGSASSHDLWHGHRRLFGGAWALSNRKATMVSSHRPSRGCPKYSDLMRLRVRTRALVSTAGTLWTRCASRGSTGDDAGAGWRMPLAGKPAIWRCKIDIALRPSGTRIEPHTPFPTLPTFEFLEVI
jgi:hypothetical protein